MCRWHGVIAEDMDHDRDLSLNPHVKNVEH